MNLTNKLGRKVLRLFPAYNRSLYKFCSRYVDRYNGDNNSNPILNGEYLFLRNELPKIGKGIVFDVGANVGDWTSSVLDINSTMNIHCFEPSKATYKMLAQKDWPENVRLNNLGLGEVEGELELNVVGKGSGMNSLYIRRGGGVANETQKEQIQITTIDTYCIKNTIHKIDFIKVDVEGHELAVFKGMKHMLRKRQVQMIQFEYGGCNLDARVYLVDIWDFLEPYGFNFYKLYPEGTCYIEKYEQRLETFKYSNWIAINEKH